MPKHIMIKALKQLPKTTTAKPLVQEECKDEPIKVKPGTSAPPIPQVIVDILTTKGEVLLWILFGEKIVLGDKSKGLSYDSLTMAYGVIRQWIFNTNPQNHIQVDLLTQGRENKRVKRPSY